MYVAVFSMRGAATALALAVRFAAFTRRTPSDGVSASEHATTSEPAISARRFILQHGTPTGPAEVRGRRSESLVRESKGAADGEGLGDGLGGRGVPDHHIHLVRLPAEG